jgi:recombinational DNA repair protein RecR
VAHLADALLKLKTELHLCEVCGNVSDHKRFMFVSTPTAARR